MGDSYSLGKRKAGGLSRLELGIVEGDVPSPIDPPAGSAFGHRMSHPKFEESVGMDLGLREIAPGHEVAWDPCCLTEEDFAKLGTANGRE